MGTISSLTAENKLPGHLGKDSLPVSVDVRIPVENNTLKVLGRRIYDEILETVKSVMLIIAIFALCERAGLFVWWIQLVEKIV